MKAFHLGMIAVVSALLLSGASTWWQPAAGQDVHSQMERAAKLKADGNMEEARQVFDALLAQLRSRGASSELTDVLNNLGDIANNSGQYDRAVELARESADVCRKLGNASCEAQALNDEGLAYSNGGKYSEAGQALEEALNMSSKAND
jgi:tetratricopeptide (TPR) repeat protein